VTWIVGVVAVALWPAPEPPELDGGTTTLVCAALAALALPAALVSHTAMLQLPGPGTVTVAGPAAGVAAGALHEPVSREDLGVEGHDTDRITRLAEAMSRSHAQTPSLAYPELSELEYGPRLTHTITPTRTPLPTIARLLHRIAPPEPEQERAR
jgi:hypothetical protein